jgi:hypothetical protein
MPYVSIIFLVSQKTVYIVGVALLLSALLGCILTVTYCAFIFQWQFATARLLFSEFFIILAPFSTIGIISGFLTGLSRTPAVSALIPAVLTFVGAIVAFQIAKTRAAAMVAALVTICFSVFLLLGSLLGSAEREISDARKNSLAQQFQDVEWEFAVEQYRKGLTLPPSSQRKTNSATTGDQGRK